MHPETPADRFDRQAARRWLKEQIVLEPEVYKRIRKMLKDAEIAAITAKHKKKKSSARYRLEATPVISLLRKDYRVNPRHLTVAGITSAAHILDLGTSKLAAKTGIDANAAERWVQAARDVKRVQNDDALPPDQVSAWSPEDFALVRALMILDSAWSLRLDHTTFVGRIDDVRLLLRRTSAPLWRMFPARREVLIEHIEFLMQNTGPARVAEAESRAKNNVARHFVLVDQLNDPSEIAGNWQYKRDDLLQLLVEKVP